MTNIGIEERHAITSTSLLGFVEGQRIDADRILERNPVVWAGRGVALDREKIRDASKSFFVAIKVDDR